MQRIMSIGSLIGATVGAIWCAENGFYIASLICTGWMSFWLFCQVKGKPRRAGRGVKKKNVCKTKFFVFNDSTVTFGTQTRIKTPAGAVLMPVHYEE